MSLFLYGKNVIREALSSKMAISLFVEEKNVSDPLVTEAKRAGIEVVIKHKEELSKLCSSFDHQGFVAKCRDFASMDLEGLISLTKDKKDPLILMLDGIEDPHNMGAILRSADAFGVDGVIIKTRGSSPLNATVAKVSTGAACHVNITLVNNLTKALDKLKEAGYWVVSSDGSGKQEFYDVDYHCPIVLVIGSEGFGISRLVLENSDFVVRIPMRGHVNSLNASVATGVLLSGISLCKNPPSR